MATGQHVISGLVWLAAAQALGRGAGQRAVRLLVPDLSVAATITDAVEPGRVSIVFTAPGTHAQIAPDGAGSEGTSDGDARREPAERYEILGVVVRNQEGAAASRAAAAGTATAAAPPRLMRRSGDYWTIVDGASVLHCKDSKGMRCLARLLAEPQAEVHVLELVAAIDGDGIAGGVAVLPSARADHAASRAGTDAGPVLDTRAKTAYRARLQDLEQTIEEAIGFGDSLRAARAEGEKDALLHQLAAALGLRGRDRRMASVSERARINVTRTIRAAVDRIGEGSPALGVHLRAAIHTGTFCTYRPPAETSVPWIVD